MDFHSFLTQLDSIWYDGHHINVSVFLVGWFDILSKYLNYWPKVLASTICMNLNIKNNRYKLSKAVMSVKHSSELSHQKNFI